MCGRTRPKLTSPIDYRQLTHIEFIQNMYRCIEEPDRLSLLSIIDYLLLYHTDYIQKWRIWEVFHSHVHCAGMYERTRTPFWVFDQLLTVFPYRVCTKRAISGCFPRSHTLCGHVRKNPTAILGL